ncbi:hypothetical protein GCM10022221_24780 [Actinocorallia aurea]
MSTGGVRRDTRGWLTRALSWSDVPLQWSEAATAATGFALVIAASRIAGDPAAGLLMAAGMVLAVMRPASREGAAWWPSVQALAALVDAVTAAAVEAGRAGPPPPADVAALTAEIRALTAAVRERREPEPVLSPVMDPALADVAGEIVRLRGLIPW